MTAGAFTPADRLELHELAARYGNTIDARDWTRFATVFTVDATYELKGFGALDCVIESAAQIVVFMQASTSHPVAHHVTNVEIDSTGDPVTMFSKIVGTLPGGLAGSADYADTVVRTPAGWQIAKRTVTLRRAPRPKG